jgi:biopolymer transport protein ExbD
VIFIVTAPMMTHAVKVDLPKASSTVNISKPQSVQLAIDAQSQVYWNSEALDMDALKDRLVGASTQEPQPELHIRADRTTPYEQVAKVMSLAAKAGLGKIGFVTDPSAP